MLLGGGIAAAFAGHLWGRAWIWGSIAILVVALAPKGAMATPYFRRVGLVTRAMAGGSTAVSPDQLEGPLRSSRIPGGRGGRGSPGGHPVPDDV